MDGMLSQEEINALLGGMGDDASSKTGDTVDKKSDTGTASSSEELSESEKDAIGEISNISMGTAATTLSTLLNQRVNITTPNVSIVEWQSVLDSYDRPCVFIQISYIDGLDGNNILILKESDGKIITDLMMGGTGENLENSEFTDLHISAICEAMNQMMGSAATSISSVLEKKVDISPPTASLIDLEGSIDIDNLGSFLKGRFVKVSFKLEVGTLINSELMQLYPIEFAKELYSKFMASTELDQQVPAGASQAATQPAPQSIPTPQPMPQNVASVNVAPQNIAPVNVAPVNVAPAQFQAFDNSISPVMQQENMDLIMDVPLEVTVELGRTNKTIKEILDFTPGTIIELNKLAGEAIDVLVNGKYVAKGEVVVIEDSFGIRLTEIFK